MYGARLARDGFTVVFVMFVYQQLRRRKRITRRVGGLVPTVRAGTRDQTRFAGRRRDRMATIASVTV